MYRGIRSRLISHWHPQFPNTENVRPITSAMHDPQVLENLVSRPGSAFLPPLPLLSVITLHKIITTATTYVGKRDSQWLGNTAASALPSLSFCVFKSSVILCSLLGRLFVPLHVYMSLSSSGLRFMF